MHLGISHLSVLYAELNSYSLEFLEELIFFYFDSLKTLTIPTFQITVAPILFHIVSTIRTLSNLE